MCENARKVARLCDLLERGVQGDFFPELEPVPEPGACPDGAWILPEEI